MCHYFPFGRFFFNKRLLPELVRIKCIKIDNVRVMKMDGFEIILL